MRVSLDLYSFICCLGIAKILGINAIRHSISVESRVSTPRVCRQRQIIIPNSTNLGFSRNPEIVYPDFFHIPISMDFTENFTVTEIHRTLKADKNQKIQNISTSSIKQNFFFHLDRITPPSNLAIFLPAIKLTI